MCTLVCMCICFHRAVSEFIHALPELCFLSEWYYVVFLGNLHQVMSERYYCVALYKNYILHLYRTRKYWWSVIWMYSMTCENTMEVFFFSALLTLCALPLKCARRKGSRGCINGDKVNKNKSKLIRKFGIEMHVFFTNLYTQEESWVKLRNHKKTDFVQGK